MIGDDSSCPVCFDLFKIGDQVTLKESTFGNSIQCRFFSPVATLPTVATRLALRDGSLGGKHQPALILHHSHFPHFMP